MRLLSYFRIVLTQSNYLSHRVVIGRLNSRLSVLVDFLLRYYCLIYLAVNLVGFLHSVINFYIDYPIRTYYFAQVLILLHLFHLFTLSFCV